MNNYDLWIDEQVPRMDGKTVLITGANSGLGFETARLLAVRGARLILAVRNPDKGKQALDSLCAGAPGAQLELMRMDLADLASIGRFAEEVRGAHQRLDVLINNAGVMAIPQRSTVDGFEVQFGTNHLGHFALTGLLLPLLLRTGRPRVVTVSSDAHKIGRINFDDLQSTISYNPWRAYGQSKLANLLFAYELQRKFETVGGDAISLGVHPGYASTNLQAIGPSMTGSRTQQSMMRLANRLFAQTAAMGALPTAYAAASPDAHGGDYIGPDGFLGQRGFPKKARSSAASYDTLAAARLWQVSEELTGVMYRFR